jgi:D-alanine--poly(phosphoribitol) ligase subunit 2
MSQKADLSRLQTCLREVLPNLTADTKENLFQAGVLDSMKVLEVVISLEEAFGVFFTPDDLTDQNLATQESILKIIQKLQGVD